MLYRVTNPHAFSVDGVHFVGTSGQNVDDIHRYSAMEDRLAIMQSVLQWGHLVPTAPDTLTCYPFQQDDPFILEQVGLVVQGLHASVSLLRMLRPEQGPGSVQGSWLGCL